MGCGASAQNEEKPPAEPEENNEEAVEPEEKDEDAVEPEEKDKEAAAGSSSSEPQEEGIPGWDGTIPIGMDNAIGNLMNRTGAPREEVIKALIATSWHGGHALTHLEMEEQRQPWHTALKARDPFASYDLADFQATVPSYWTNQDLSTGFDARCEPLDTFRIQMQELLDGTFTSKRTRDREGDMPSRLRLRGCERIEDASLWCLYQAAKREILAKHESGVRPVCELDGSPDHGHVKTSEFLSDEFAQRLDDRVNEFYLWHGTTEAGAKGISENGFKIDMAGHSAGTMFGPGCYFAECSSKSDEYTKEMSNGHRAMLLCRVVCGEMFRTTEPKMWAIREALLTGEYDTVLGDREAERGTYREFVVFDQAMIYPEYLVEYVRA